MLDHVLLALSPWFVLTLRVDSVEQASAYPGPVEISALLMLSSKQLALYQEPGMMDGGSALDGADRVQGPAEGRRGARWYVLYLRPRHEKKVHQELERQGFESFLPTVKELRQWSDRKKKVEMPLFPGYDFVRIDLRDRVRVLQVDGVVRFVAIRNQPTPVPDEQIHSLKVVVGSPGTLRNESHIPEGQLVEVTAGPFAGVRGIVVRGRSSTRVLIAVDGIQRAVSVEVPTALLKEVVASSKA